MKTDIEKLFAELQKALPTFEKKLDSDSDSISIYARTFYTADRQKLIELEKKYGTLLWCDTRGKKVHFRFHSIGVHL